MFGHRDQCALHRPARFSEAAAHSQRQSHRSHVRQASQWNPSASIEARSKNFDARLSDNIA